MKLKLDSEMQLVGAEGTVMEPERLPLAREREHTHIRRKTSESEVSVGEKIDFNEVFRTLGPRTRRIVRRLGVPQRMLDDAVQDAFLTAFAKRKEFRGDSSVGTWITSIAVRKAANYRRRAVRAIDESAVANAEALSRQTSNGASPYQIASWLEADRKLQQLLETLSELERSLFVLVTYEEMQINEAADILGVPRRRAYSIHETARLKLRTALARVRAHDERRTG